MLKNTINAEILEFLPDGDYRFSLHIIEDEVVGNGSGFDQTNYDNATAGHPYQGAGDPIIGYVHRDVVRDMATGTWGESGIIPTSPAPGETYSYTTSITLSQDWDENLMRIVGFVNLYGGTGHSGHAIINAVSEHLNQATAYSCEITEQACDKTSSIQQMQEASNTAIAYPNPAQDDVYLKFKMKEGKSLNAKIYGADGRLVVSATGLQGRPGINEFKIDTRQLQNGLYNIVLFDGQSVVVTKQISVMKKLLFHSMHKKGYSIFGCPFFMLSIEH